MELNTASAAVAFARKLEEDSSAFYQDLSRRYASDGNELLSLIKENQKNIIRVERSYYEIISDAIEGCFAFKMEAGEYAVQTELKDMEGYADALSRALEMEEKITRFYTDAAEQSRLFLADVSRVFAAIARKRENRRQKLQSLLQKEA